MNCNYCKKEIEPGTGSVIIKKDGKITRYCSNKCRKNHQLKRNPQKLKWVTKERKTK